MRNERITFRGATGSRLSARLSLPPGGDVVSCALVAHCFTCSKDLKPVVNVSRALTQQRIAVVRLEHTKLYAEDEANCESGEARMDRLDQEVTLIGPLDAEQRARLLKIAARCPVHQTLDAGVKITTTPAEGTTKDNGDVRLSP